MKGRTTASATSRISAVSVSPRQRSTYRFVSTATLTSRRPRLSDLARQWHHRRPFLLSTYQRCPKDSAVCEEHRPDRLLPPEHRWRPRSNSCAKRALADGEQHREQAGSRGLCIACTDHRQCRHFVQAHEALAIIASECPTTNNRHPAARGCCGRSSARWSSWGWC